MKKKHSSVLNSQIKIVQSGKLPENFPGIIKTQHSISWGNSLLEKEKYLVIE